MSDKKSGDKSGFAQLLEDVEMLAKAQTAGDGDDKKIAAAAGKDNAAAAAAAAGEGGANGGQGAAAAAEGAAAAGEGKKKDDEGEELTKALSPVTGTAADGSSVEYLDATELLKSLSAQIGTINDERELEHEQLGKALGLMHDLLKSHTATIAAQTQTIGELRTQVDAMGAGGRGRKAAILIHEKTSAADLTKAAAGGAALQQGIPADQFLQKAQSAFDAGKLSGHDLRKIETTLNHGWQPEDALVKRVAAASATA